jgi:cell filamentation protein
VTLDKYGTGQDPYCFPDTAILRNRFGIHDEQILAEAERALSEVAADSIDFAPPPHDLAYLQQIHRRLFSDLYDWAGQLRTVDISKNDTRFCVTSRIEPEANKLFKMLADANGFQGLDRVNLINACAELFGDLNVVHPFREGNGRAQRILFEHIIVNAGYEISWWPVEPAEWIQANIDAVGCDYEGLVRVFEQCVGQAIRS